MLVALWVIAVKKPPKWDGLNETIKDEVKRELDRRLVSLIFARLHLYFGAAWFWRWKLVRVTVEEAYQSATRRINTSVLTQIMKMAQEMITNPHWCKGVGSS